MRYFICLFKGSLQWSEFKKKKKVVLYMEGDFSFPRFFE